jgi:hypothetical protein
MFKFIKKIFTNVVNKIIQDSPYLYDRYMMKSLWKIDTYHGIDRSAGFGNPKY